MIKDNKQSEQKFNRLINEKSPYLLQHATNPVDWYPWGEEAFEKARKEDKPIFLSIGYSTCHWCHVMAHESFEDPEVAKLMNETFVNIKVDREERPEIDNIYMTVCQMIRRSCGWPLTIIMDADKHPFTAATYIPKKNRFGQMGMLDFIPKIKEYWENNREELQLAAKEVVDNLKEMDYSGGELLTQETLNETFKEVKLLFDDIHGGFKGAPKFPTPHKLLFLLRYWYRTKDNQALEIVEKTLQSMRFGGIYDHIGFGFHRYSTDSQWLLPHFEKMLYDQALLIIAYAEAYQVTKKAIYKEVVEEIITYVLRDLYSPEGGFYSAEDADSEGEEGKFYVWAVDEVQNVLSKDESELFLKVYNFSEEGNFREEATKELTGKNIPHLKQSTDELAKEIKIPLEELKEKLDKIRQKLFKNRELRIRPHKDDKILTDWNGLMIAALAIAGRIFANEEYITKAKNAVNFILQKMKINTRRLLHRYRDGQVAVQGLLDDYVFFIWGLLELYETTFDVNYLKEAIQFNKTLLDHFWDKEKGGFYFTPDDGEQIIIRKKEIYDGAIPSGNSVALLNLLKLSRITMDLDFEDKAMTINKLFSIVIEQSLLAYTMFLTALEFAYGPTFEVVIIGKKNSDDTNDMINALRGVYVPNKIVLFVPEDEESPEIIQVTEFVKHKNSRDNLATAHVCINRFCKFPTTDIKKMLDLLNVI
ncbi:MAG: thioredoxin domain-containing protein [Asgard group archaeon]|nr:thioredoxin domain-containing protein [Asgard group archaeon]